MRIEKVLLVGLVLAVGALFLASPVQAKDKYQCSVIEVATNPTNFTWVAGTNKSKMKISPSYKDGDGGMVMQLGLKALDCPLDPKGNDGGEAGKCGPKDDPVLNHVLALSVNAVGLDLVDVAGVLYDVEGGKAKFVGTGKNKIGGTLFGAMVGMIFNTPMGIGQIKLHEAGSNPLACETAPLPPGSPCLDGGVYAMTGINVGDDATLSCDDNTDCALQQICFGGLCITEPCAADVDCDQNGTGNGGTGQCGPEGCCDPAIDPLCEGYM